MTIAPEQIAEIFERAPVLADRVRGNDPESVVSSARSEIARMTEDERIALLNAHPRIGADPASLSAASRREQAGDADAATLRDLARMNDEYERRFGFRLVVFVAGRSKADLVPVIRERLERSRDEEIATGIEEFLAISRDRLRRMSR
jgi:2-oxo-4-hydroxy-4-carboxy--5-ureidoimidazoline (OHCU) decarboxylase